MFALNNVQRNLTRKITLKSINMSQTNNGTCQKYLLHLKIKSTKNNVSKINLISQVVLSPAVSTFLENKLALAPSDVDSSLNHGLYPVIHNQVVSKEN